jgi:hypothetical protein
MRHPGSCAQGHRFGEVQYQLIALQSGLFGTRERKVQFHEGDLHAVREHGAPLPDALATLLRSL